MLDGRFILDALWAASVLLQAGVLAVITRRKLARQYPIFTAYTAGYVLTNTVLLFLHWSGASYRAYFNVFWASEFVAVILGLGVIYEIYANLFGSDPALSRLGRVLFHFVAAMLAILVTVNAATSQAGGGLSNLVAAILLLRQSLNIVMAGLLIFLFVFASYFKLTWGHYVFGISFGLGFYTTFEIAGHALQLYRGLADNLAYYIVRAAVYNSAVVIWMRYLATREPQGFPAALPLGELREWSRSLSRMLR